MGWLDESTKRWTLSSESIKTGTCRFNAVVIPKAIGCRCHSFIFFKLLDTLIRISEESLCPITDLHKGITYYMAAVLDRVILYRMLCFGVHPL